MLDCCETIEEARTILEYEGRKEEDRQFTKYPRLDQALNANLKKIVTHDFCQQILREEWHSSPHSHNLIQLQIREHFTSHGKLRVNLVVVGWLVEKQIF